MVREAPRSVACPAYPVSCCAWCPAADVSIGYLKIIFGSGSDDNAVDHLSVRVFAFQIVKYIVSGSAHAFADLRKAAPNASHGVQLTGHILISLSIENDSFGFTLHGEHKGTSGFLHVPHQARGIALEGGQGMNVLGDIDHGAIVASIRMLCSRHWAKVDGLCR